MNKFNSGLVKGLREQEAKERAKTNKRKFKKAVVKGTVSPISFFVRKTATIILLILATIGLLALIYPNTREAMFDIVRDQWEQIKTLLNL